MMTSIRRASLIAICFCVLFAKAGIAQVVGFSGVLESTNANEVDGWSETDIDYGSAYYYNAAVIGYLYEGQAQKDVEASRTEYLDPCDSNPPDWRCDGNPIPPPIVWTGVETTAPVHQGSVYTIYSEHYLITYFYYEDGYYNPYQYPPGASFTSPGGGDPSGTGYDPGSGQVYVDEEIIYLGYTYFQFGTAPPSISSIDPPSVVRGKSGTIHVQGQNLRDDLGRLTASSRDGDLTVTVASGDAASASLNYSVSGTASIGPHQFTVSNTWGESEPKDLTVGYPPAVVTGVSPPSWPAGGDYDVTVVGTGFGDNPTVSAIAPGVSSGVAYNSSSDGTQTHFHVHVDINAPNEPVQIVVIPGYTGSTFICGACNGGSPNGIANAAVLAQTPTGQLRLVSNATDATNCTNGELLASSGGGSKTVKAGQQIWLCVIHPPQGITMSDQSWQINQSDITGGFIDYGNKGYPNAESGGKEAPLPATSNVNSIKFYFHNINGSESVHFSAALSNGEPYAASADFNVQGPTNIRVVDLYPRSPVTIRAVEGTTLMGIGKVPAEDPTVYDLGFTLEIQADNSSAQQNTASPFWWVQIIQSDSLQRYTEGVMRRRVCPSTTPSPSLDGFYPTAASSKFGDAPTVGPLPATDGEVGVKMAFKLYALWNPLLPDGCTPSPGDPDSCSSIPVPLGNLNWDWSACGINTKQTTSNGTTYLLQCPAGNGNAGSFTPSREFPDWQGTTPAPQTMEQAYKCFP
ncbi:hypothetical protein FTW19_21455 [Terriglobus albidus]|uniref:Uncharacterized protein n=1 Tax=Terriglobus albidus TaxID=1592106 RepID=A0A5B9EIU4_9BACT|nr:hypothetical protein [Terriglobus albidus]QEE30321.1 hypothetical protein FTW19_21455 [Terriglobus albidus]